jgi:hypothetical protein
MPSPDDALIAALQAENARLREALDRIFIETINRRVSDDSVNAQVMQWVYAYTSEVLATPPADAGRGAALLAVVTAAKHLLRGTGDYTVDLEARYRELRDALRALDEVTQEGRTP